MYEHMTPKQRNALLFGARLRTIGAVKGLLGTGRSETDPFTQEERNAILKICQDAHQRTKAAYEGGCAKLAAADCGAEAEQRQYTGK